MRKVCLAVVCLLVTTLANARGQQDFAAFVKEVGPSVASIQTSRTDGKPLASATGFLAKLPTSEGSNRVVIITNRHVLRGAMQARATFPGKEPLSITRIVAEDVAQDIVAAELEATPGDLKPLPFSPKSPDAGTRIVVIGNPAGLSNSVSDGLVAAIRDVDGLGTVIQMTAPISPGSSGSPVLALDGTVVGVATFQLSTGQNLNFAIPASRIFSLKLRQPIALSSWAAARKVTDISGSSPIIPSTDETVNWKWWLTNITPASIDSDHRNWTRAPLDTVLLHLAIADFYVRVGELDEARAHLDKVISLPDVTKGEVFRYDEQIVGLQLKLDRKLAASLFASSATNGATQGQRHRFIALYSKRVGDAEMVRQSINSIRSVADATPNLPPIALKPTPSYLISSDWRLAMRPRVNILYELSLTLAEAGDFDSARQVLDELSKAERGPEADAQLNESALRGQMAQELAAASRLAEAEQILRPMVGQKYFMSMYYRAQAAIAQRAFILGDRERYDRIVANVLREMSTGDAETKASALGFGVDPFLVAGNFQEAMKVVAKISDGQGKAEAVDRIVRRYAETGDRLSAMQLVPIIPSIAGQFRALVRIAELSDAAGDNTTLDAILKELERMCEENGRQRLTLGEKLPINAIIRFGYLKARANPSEGLRRLQFSTLTFGDLRPAVLLGVSEAVWERSK